MGQQWGAARSGHSSGPREHAVGAQELILERGTGAETVAHLPGTQPRAALADAPRPALTPIDAPPSARCRPAVREPLQPAISTQHVLPAHQLKHHLLPSQAPPHLQQLPKPHSHQPLPPL